MPASYGGSGGSGGGASLPTTPAAALLDAGAPSTIVALDGSGVGTELTYAATRTAIDAAQAPARIATSGALHHWRTQGSAPWTDLGTGGASLTIGGGTWETDTPTVIQLATGGSAANTLSSAGSYLRATVAIASGADLTLALSIGSRGIDPVLSGASTVAILWTGLTSPANYLALVATSAGLRLVSGVAGTGANGPDVALSWAVPHRLVVTYVQSTGVATMYLDGFSVGTATFAGTRAALTELAVAGLGGGAFGHNSIQVGVDDVMVWTSALGAAQVLADWYTARRSMVAR